MPHPHLTLSLLTQLLKDAETAHKVYEEGRKSLRLPEEVTWPVFYATFMLPRIPVGPCSEIPNLTEDAADSVIDNLDTLLDKLEASLKDKGDDTLRVGKHGLNLSDQQLPPSLVAELDKFAERLMNTLKQRPERRQPRSPSSLTYTVNKEALKKLDLDTLHQDMHGILTVAVSASKPTPDPLIDDRTVLRATKAIDDSLTTLLLIKEALIGSKVRGH